MNKEEAIRKVKGCLTDYFPMEDYGEVEEIIKALEQEPCEDVISRSETIEYLNTNMAWYDENGEMTDSDEKLKAITDLINGVPSATHTPKKCHNENHDYAECDQFVCSNCGIELQDWHRVERDEDDGDVTYHEYEFNYCPNCGAKIGKDVLTTMMSKKINNLVEKGKNNGNIYRYGETYIRKN